MSRVMEAINKVEAARAKLEKAHEEENWNAAGKAYVELQQEARQAYDPLLAHTKKIHRNLANLAANEDDLGYNKAFYGDLISLLPDDWEHYE